ncbi:MAG: protein kinase [Myxococcota bacterium]
MASRDTIRVFEKYEVVRRLATGGMGDIFLARQLGVAGFQRLVVLKSLRPDVVERDDFFAQFLNEARTAATLNHPNVVAVYEIDEYRGVYFIAMEYIDGTDLGAVLRAAQGSKQRLPFRFSAGVIHDAALGLAHAHAQEIVHRDVSPQNIMVRLDGIAKVVDFGIAAAANQIDPFRGRLQGKLRYMSPEQIRGRSLTGASDQFSLGVVLWELITQRRLFASKEPTAVMREISTTVIQPPSVSMPDLPPALDQTVMRMLSKDPGQRFPSLKDAAIALRSFLESSGGAADQQIGKFVQVMVGPSVRERTRDLTPERVTISGLLDTAEIRCPSCQAENSLRNRYCRDCGAPLSEQNARPEEASPTPRRAEALVPRRLEDLRSLLKSGQAGLDQLITGQRRRAVVLAAKVLRGKLGRDESRSALEQRLLRAESSVLEAFDPEIVRLTSSECLVVFGATEARAADPARALRAAEELRGAVESLRDELPAILGVQVVINAGEIDVLHPSDATHLVRGPALEEAERLLSGLGPDSRGTFLTPSLAQRLQAEARFQPHPSGLEAVEALRTPSVDSRLPLIGRRDELVIGREALTTAARTSGVRVLFVSDVGAGKSRFLEELAQLSEKQGFATVYLRGAQGEASTSRGLSLEILARALERFVMRGEPGEPMEEQLAAVDLMPATRALLAEALEGRARAEAQREIKSAARTALVRLSKIQPVALLIDDLHTLTVEAQAELAALAASIDEARIAFLASADAASTTGLSEIASQPRVVVLEPLSDEKLLALGQAYAGGGALPPPVAQLVLVRAAGNPGLATQIIDALIAMGGMVREGDRWLATTKLMEIELPTQLDALVAARIDRLSRAAQAFLRVASVLGSPFSTRVVLAVLRFSGDEDALLEEVTSTQLVRASLGSVDSWEFRQHSVEARVEASLLEPDRRGIHRRIADLFERDPDPSPAILLATARHAAATGDDRRAAQAARRAARKLPGTAAQMYDLALAATHRLLSGPRRSPELVEEALSLVADATPSIASRDLSRARKILDELAPLTSEVSAPTARARALRARAEVNLALGRLSEADADLAAAAALLVDVVGPSPRAEIMETQAKVLEERGRFSEAAQRLTEALAAYEEQDADAELWRRLNALGRLYLRLGEVERARPLFEAAQSAAEVAGSEQGRAAALTNRAGVAAERGAFEEALRLLEEAQVTAAGADDALGRARIAYNRGRVLLSAARPAEAQASLQEAARLASELDWEEGIALTHQALSGAGLLGQD